MQPLIGIVALLIISCGVQKTDVYAPGTKTRLGLAELNKWISVCMLDKKSIPRNLGEVAICAKEKNGDISSYMNDEWGQPIGYRTEELLPNVKFLLYSYGPNRLDEGGKGDDIALLGGLESYPGDKK
jgi:hypothetical protein